MRGTTPYIYFKILGTLDEHEEIWVTGAQNGRIVVDRTKADVQWDGERAYIHLTQEETLNMKENAMVTFQVRAKFLDGNVYKTKPFNLPVTELLKGGVI